MSQPATISISTPAPDASTSTLFDAPLKIIIGIGLVWKAHEDLVHEIKKLEIRCIEGAASTDITNMVKRLLIHVDGFVPTLVELLILCEELLELALTEAETAELARQKQLEKEQAQDYQTLKAQTERAEKHKKDFEAFCAEMDKNMDRFL